MSFLIPLRPSASCAVKRANREQAKCQLFATPLLSILGDLPSIKSEKPACKVGDGGNLIFEPTPNEMGWPYSTSIRCATFRHAEMPKGLRGAPTLLGKVHLTAHHTAPRVGFLLFPTSS